VCGTVDARGDSHGADRRRGGPIGACRLTAGSSSPPSAAVYDPAAEGYAFYVLNRTTGAVVQTLRVKTGPGYILPKGGNLFVRTYDTDYVFRVAQGP
jgi:hypothetical protein